jgi:capsular polysaccharide transport system permease protein
MSAQDDKPGTTPRENQTSEPVAKPAQGQKTSPSSDGNAPKQGQGHLGQGKPGGMARMGGPAKQGGPGKPNGPMKQRMQAEMQRPVLPTASPAKLEKRHYGMAISFVLFVILPSFLSAFYLYTRAADQYASYVGFSVRSETAASPTDVLGGLGSLVGVTSSSTSDTDILYKFIQSRDLVERVNENLDLREIWSKALDDPIFSYRGGGALEDLVKEWESKVRIYYDNGMIDLRILAFDPVDAQNIAKAILDEGGTLINELNDIAREDALRYARSELDRSQELLRTARQNVSEFRNRYQLVDPTADVQSQIGVVTSLQQQLAEQLVSLGMLQSNAQSNDPRISQTDLRIQVIREQIEAEREKFGSNSDDVALSELVGQYEVLAVDRQFAETSYTAALASYESARAEAVRQSRYLASYIRPTLAQEAEFPQRTKLLLIIMGFLSIIWIIGSLVFYSLRDRR